MTSTIDSCCQRAKVYRWVTQPVGFANMLWSCCSIFFWKAPLLFFKVLLQSAFIIFLRHLCYFSKIIFQSALSKRFYYFSKRFYYSSKRFYCFSKRFYSIFLSASKRLFFYSECKPALIFYSSKYETVSNFCFKTCISFYFNF